MNHDTVAHLKAQRQEIRALLTLFNRASFHPFDEQNAGDPTAIFNGVYETRIALQMRGAIFVDYRQAAAFFERLQTHLLQIEQALQKKYPRIAELAAAWRDKPINTEERRTALHQALGSRYDEAAYFLRIETSPIWDAPAEARSILDSLDTQINSLLAQATPRTPGPPAAIQRFELAIDPLRDGSYPVRLTTAAGEQAIGALTLPPADDAVEPILAKLTYRDDQTIFSEDEVMLLGQRLYQLLFQGTTASLFQSATSAARKDKQPLQLELQLASHPDLVPVATLPWEFLTDPQGHPLLTLHSLVRSLPHTSPIPPLMVDGPLTMLLAWALPAELAAAYPLNIAAEVHAIQTQLQPLIAANQLMLHILPHATPLSLNRALEDHQPHLLHLLGHGQAATSRAPQLVLETEEGTMQPMSPKQLAIALQGSQVRLVVLNTCHSGAQGTQLFQAFGPALLASGVPAIVGMQASVLDRAGRIFAAELYRTLGKTGSIDQAVQQGRKALIMTDISQVDWGLVTLYLRARDGRLFGMPEVTESPPKPSPPSGGSGTVFNQTGQQVGTQYNAAGTQTIHTTHQSGGINFGNARIGSIGSVTTNDQPAAPQHVYHVYEGGNIVSGDTFEMSGNFSGAILNIKNTLTNTIQTVNGMAQAAPDQKQELARLLQQLQAALMTVPAEHQETAEAVADTAKELIEKAAKDKPNKTTIQITAEGLKAAAGNLAVVVPMIIPLATQIVQGVQKLIGG